MPGRGVGAVDLAVQADAVILLGSSTDFSAVLVGLRADGIDLAQTPVLASDRLATSTLDDELAAADLSVLPEISGVRFAFTSTSDFDRRVLDSDESVESTFFAAETHDCLIHLALAATGAGSIEPSAVRAQK